MRSIRDRFRRFGKFLWLRPASPAERRLRALRLTAGAGLHPAFASVRVAACDATNLATLVGRSGAPSRHAGV